MFWCAKFDIIIKTADAFGLLEMMKWVLRFVLSIFLCNETFYFHLSKLNPETFVKGILSMCVAFIRNLIT